MSRLWRSKLPSHGNFHGCIHFLCDMCKHWIAWPLAIKYTVRRCSSSSGDGTLWKRVRMFQLKPTLSRSACADPERPQVNWWLMISGFRGGNGSKMLYDAISLHVGTFTTKTIRDMKIRFLGWSTRSSSCLAFSCFFILRGAFAWRVRWWLHQHASNATLRLIGWDHDLLSASAPLGDAMCRGRRLWMVATQKLILLWCMNGLDGWGGFHAYITFTKSSKSKWWYFVYGKYGKSSICAINQIKRRLLLDHRRRLQFPHSMVLDRISSWAQGKNRAPPRVPVNLPRWLKVVNLAAETEETS